MSSVCNNNLSLNLVKRNIKLAWLMSGPCIERGTDYQAFQQGMHQILQQNDPRQMVHQSAISQQEGAACQHTNQLQQQQYQQQLQRNRFLTLTVQVIALVHR
jgi:hypothetical protein